jgi:hypothetical protein
MGQCSGGRSTSVVGPFRGTAPDPARADVSGAVVAWTTVWRFPPLLHLIDLLARDVEEREQGTMNLGPRPPPSVLLLKYCIVRQRPTTKSWLTPARGKTGVGLGPVLLVRSLVSQIQQIVLYSLPPICVSFVQRFVPVR